MQAIKHYTYTTQYLTLTKRLIYMVKPACHTLFVLLLAAMAACKHTPAQQVKSTNLLPNYDSVKTAIEQQRLLYSSAYSKATDTVTRHDIVQQARNYITGQIMQNLLPQWYGTPWAFEGTTTQPRNGQIACGYFVTTVLQHAGFNLLRVKWACVPSETLIKAITDKRNIKHYINTEAANVETGIKASGPGIYIVGLDMHVGFIINTGSEISFVHSNYYEPATGVMSQPLNSINPLRDSKYRVVGKLLNDEMVRRWIMGERLDG